MEDNEMDMNGNGQEGENMMLSVVGRNSDPGASDPKDSLDNLSGPRYLLEGDLVEVLQKDRGLRGSWHPAIVLQVLPGRRIVEYEQLVTSDGSEKLRETVHFGEGSKLGGSRAVRACATGYSRKAKERIRPRPPPILSSSWKTWTEGTWVDCFYEDAWWEGILTEDVRNAGDEDLVAPKTSVAVFFPDEKDTSEQNVTNLRLTQDWNEKTGTWDQRQPRPESKKQSRVGRPKTNHEAKESIIPKLDQLESSEAQPLADTSNLIANGAGFTNTYVNGCEGTSFDHLDEEESKSDPKMKQDDGAPEVASTNMELSPTRARQKLKDAGWRVCESILKKTGKSKWFYRPPKEVRDPDCPKIFSTLLSAMSYHATMMGMSNGSEAVSTVSGSNSAPPAENEDKSLGAISNQANGGMVNNMAIVLRSEAVHDIPASDFHVELSDDNARAYLTEMGWDITKFVRTKAKVRWQYRAPKVNQTPSGVFYSLRRAVEENNRRILTSAEGTGVGRYTIGLLRSTQFSTSSRKTTEGANAPNKRTRLCSFQEKETEDADGEGNDIDPDLTDFTTSKQTIVPYLDSSEIVHMDHDDNPRATNSGKKRLVGMRSGAEINPDEIQLKVTMDEARELLRAAGWTLNEVVRDRKRRSSIDWFYKAPAFGSSQGVTYHSLCTALVEYNRRVRCNNELCSEQRPTILLKRSSHKVQSSRTPTNTTPSTKMQMDETEHKDDSMNGTTPINKSKSNPSPCSSGKQGRRRSIFSTEEADMEREYVSVSSQDPEKISENLLYRFAAATNTSKDVQSLMKNCFGGLLGEVLEDDRGYLLQLNILDFNKGQLRVFVEGDKLVLKAIYCVESVQCESPFSAKYSGALSCRLTLPDGVLHASVTASQLKPGVLHLTLPKAKTPHKKFEIPIK